jgi:hypothetical protein
MLLGEWPSVLFGQSKLDILTTAGPWERPFP